MYLKENKWAKVELALVKGKAKHDKREAIAERDAKRAMEKTLKQRE
jgi:SsrA-binding protein